MKTLTQIALIVSVMGLMMIFGCSNSTSPGTGELRMFLTDSPAQYDQVNIVVTKVEVHSTGSDSLGGWETVNNDTVTYNLLTLRNGANVLFGDAMLPAGMYTQIRLSIGSGSNVVIGGVQHPLDISSATGLKLNHNFNIASGTIYLLTLDFDAERSIVLTGNNVYKLKPVIRVEANDSVGSISGIVLPAAAHAQIMTQVDADTVIAFSDTTGAFYIPLLPVGSYNLFVSSPVLSFNDTTVTDVIVNRQQDYKHRHCYVKAGAVI